MDARALRAVRGRFNVDLHPVLSDNVHAGVCDILSNMLLRYSEDFEGVILSFSNVKVKVHSGALLHHYFPYPRVTALADLIVLKPVEKLQLVATVSKIAPDFIGLLWAGVVNATVPKTHMRADWQHNWSAKRWESCKDAEQVIMVGTHVLFDVTQVQRDGAFLHLQGAMLQEGTGIYTPAQGARLEEKLAGTNVAH